MLIKKNIATIVLLFVLHHSLTARAEGADTSPPAATTRQDVSSVSPEQPSASVGQTTSAPLAETPLSSPTDTSSQPDAVGPRLPLIDELHVEISERLVTTAAWLDSFFADERSLAEDNRSYMRARYDVFKEEGANATFRPNLDFRLALPQLEKKAHIVVSAESAENPATTTAAPGTATDRLSTTEARNVTTALHYIIRDTEQQNFIVRTGAQFTRDSPALFVAPRYRYFLPVEAWGFRYTQEVVWNTRTSWQVNSSFDLERQLPHDLFFRTSVTGNWLSSSTGYFYGLNFSLRQPLDLKHALEYEWDNSFQTRPAAVLSEILFRVRYRQSFWREWVFFEIAPQYRFPWDRNYIGTPGILFKLEMYFGR